MIAVAVACLVASALVVAFGLLADVGIDVEDQAPELDPEDPAPLQTFDQWRMTGHQAWPGPRPAARPAAPSSTPSAIEPPSPDSMALDVEAMIARYRREIDELVDAAEQKIGELAHA